MSYRIGIDLGGTAVKAGITDDDCRLLSKVQIPTGEDHSPSAIAARILTAAQKAAEAAGISLKDCSTAGAGIPGATDSRTGLVKRAPNLGWENVPFRSLAETLFPCPFFIGNDANCAVVGEWKAGAARGLSDVLMLTLGTGVGGGILSGGRLIAGGDGYGAELGHLTVHGDGLLCGCGLRGCLEAYVSATALIRETRLAMERTPDSAMHAYVQAHGGPDGITAFACAAEGDPAAKAVTSAYCRELALGIGSLVNVFRPQVVLLGGGVSLQGENLTRPVEQLLPEYVFASREMGCPPVRCATLGNDAGILGAAMLATLKD